MRAILAVAVNSLHEESDGSSCNIEDESAFEVPECQEIRELQSWIVRKNIPFASSDELLQILRRRLVPGLPKCTKTLLKHEFQFNVEMMLADDYSEGEFFYFGIKNQLEAFVNTELHTPNEIQLLFNIDGFSPFKSSNTTVWPILCKVYTKEDLYEPFTVAVYSGKGKPKSPTDYLLKFVQELNLLLSQGIVINNRQFEVKIKCFVCDTPARSF